MQGSDPNRLKGSGSSNPYGFEGPRPVWSVWVYHLSYPDATCLGLPVRTADQFGWWCQGEPFWGGSPAERPRQVVYGLVRAQGLQRKGLTGPGASTRAPFWSHLLQDLPTGVFWTHPLPPRGY